MANNVERFQSFCQQYVNRKVREHFKDLGGENWQPDFTNDRHVTRAICTHDDDDPLTLTVGRLLIYNLEVKGEDESVTYSIPADFLHETVRGVPQVILNFRETTKDARTNKRPRNPLRAQHFIRIKNDFDSEAEVLKIANKVKSIFATPRFHFDKGRIKYTYLDKEKKHDFRIFSENESEAKKLIDKLLAINNQQPNWEYLSETKRPHKNFNEIEYVQVNGKRYKRPQHRPMGRVHFQGAELYVNGTQANIHLIDLTRSVKNVIVKP